MQYPEERPPYISLGLATLCATLIAKVEHAQDKSLWWIPLAVVALLWVCVGLSVYLRDRVNKRLSRLKNMSKV